jgi:hypothetical protein
MRAVPADPKPSSMRLSGSFVEYGEENGNEGDIEVARRLDYPDGRVAFIVEHADDDGGWELRVESSDGRSFRGSLSIRDGGTEHAVEMTLWRAADGEAEWLLLGTWTDEDGAEIPWSLDLYVDEDD